MSTSLVKPLLVVSFCIYLSFSSILKAQAPSTVTHKIGVELAFGQAGSSATPDSYYGNPEEIWPQEHYRAVLGYHVFFLQEQLHLGLGMGFQHKRISDVYTYEDNTGTTRYTSVLRIQRDLILPIQVGYQSQLGGKHNFTADVLLTPLYLVQRKNRPINQNFFPAEPPKSSALLGLETGLQLGYQLDFSEKMSLQLAVLGTVEPFARDFLDRQYYTVGLNAGLRYQL